MYTKQQIQQFCRVQNIRPKKRRGQNFLIHEKTADDIASLAVGLVSAGNTGDTSPALWEIGPGAGALTGKALERVRFSNPKCNTVDDKSHAASGSAVSSLSVFEIDRGLCAALSLMYADDVLNGQLRVVEGDVFITIDHEAHARRPAGIFGNLPYSVGVRILMNIAHRPHLCVPMCVMLQKEAAQRICAEHNTKTYGISSVVLQSVYDITIERTIARSFFYPYAHVDSVVCLMTPKVAMPRHDSAADYSNDVGVSKYMSTLTTLVKQAFAARRKKLANTLVPHVRAVYGAAADDIIREIDTNARAEHICVQDYCDMARRACAIV